MNINLSALAVRERGITLFFIIVIAILGIYSFMQLGRAEDPVFTVKVLTVSAVWPGATAQEMQQQVAEPLEKRLQELRGFERVETVSRPGLILMTLTLKDSISAGEVEQQFYQARKKLSDETTKLPNGVLGPFVNDEYSDVTFALYGLEAQDLAPRIISRQAENIRQRLLQIDGVEKVNILGERPERIFIEFTHAKLTTLGISFDDIFKSLAQQNAITAAGSISIEGPQIFIRINSAYDSLQAIRDTPIGTFKLSDIAEVKRGYEDPPTLFIRNNGQSSLLLAVVMKQGWNGLDLGRSLEAEMQTITTELPLGMTFSKITDQADNISKAVNEFMLKFIAAIAVVMLVSLISLGWRVGIIVAAAIPLTLSIVMLIMLCTDRVFDRITLGALIISLGLLVDDAIIAIETMVVRLEEGFERTKAAAYAWSHTAAPMLSGTLVTVVGFVPVGFALSSTGEYTENIFWVVGYALLASWIVAVTFIPYLGVKLLPDIKPIVGGHNAIYSTPRYQKLRQKIIWAIKHKFAVSGFIVGLFLLSIFAMGLVKQQFFPISDRVEVLVEVQMPIGTSIQTTSDATKKVENWLGQQAESLTTTAYIGQGAPRFFLSYNPELPDPSFAKIVILTPDTEARIRLKSRLRQAIADGLVPEARVRVTELFFGPSLPFPVSFRVMGPDIDILRSIADEVTLVVRANPHMRQTHQDWGTLQPNLHFVLDQERIRAMGLSSEQIAQQLQFILTGITVTQVRENIRTVDVIARSGGTQRFDPARIEDFSLINKNGQSIPLSQIGHIEIGAEEAIMKRRNMIPTIKINGDIDESMQPDAISQEILQALQPIINKIPSGYRIEIGGSIEEGSIANESLKPIFPIMILLMLTIIIIQVRSLPAMIMVFLTAPLGLIGTVLILLLFNQPFGFTSILGLIGLSGILMRNTLILIGQIQTNQTNGLSPYHAVIEATVQRARPVILTALAAVLAFIPLTTSMFWGSMAYTLIGGVTVGTVLTLFFLPALYAIWFKVKID